VAAIGEEEAKTSDVPSLKEPLMSREVSTEFSACECMLLLFTGERSAHSARAELS
jgi:hypothetical protein